MISWGHGGGKQRKERRGGEDIHATSISCEAGTEGLGGDGYSRTP